MYYLVSLSDREIGIWNDYFSTKIGMQDSGNLARVGFTCYSYFIHDPTQNNLSEIFTILVTFLKIFTTSADQMEFENSMRSHPADDFERMG